MATELAAAQGTGSSASRPLHVGLIAPPWVPVPPPVYGGTERAIDQLARGLQRLGCRVTLFTTGDSRCLVERKRWYYPHALGTLNDPELERPHVEAAYRELADVDVIHDHTLAGPTWAGAHLEGLPPVVTTIHSPITPELSRHYRSVAPWTTIVAISEAQRHSAAEVPVDRVIHHGIDTDEYPVGDGSGRFLLFLGRMHPDKGAHRAIAVARAAGRPIVLAAKMWEPEEERYYREKVEPLLGPGGMYIGEVGGRRKLDLLGRAHALINPIRWPEPFGLGMIQGLGLRHAGCSRSTRAPRSKIVEEGSTRFPLP